MDTYSVRRSKVTLFIGYFLTESCLIAILTGMLIIWHEAPAYLDWPVAITSYIATTVLFHFLLFLGTFYCVKVKGETIEYHAFLRRTKRFQFSDIQKTMPSGMDVKLIGQGNKKLFYVKCTDRNFDRFMSDISAR